MDLKFSEDRTRFRNARNARGREDLQIHGKRTALELDPLVYSQRRFDGITHKKSSEVVTQV